MKNELHHIFSTPPAEFSPMPFWFWNDQLSESEITRQIEDFASKGVMGFVIHPRKGMPKQIPYLSDAFMHYVKHAVKEAARLNMHVVLYDEAMYPSGSAHGLVVKSNPEYATRALRMEMLSSADNGNLLEAVREFSVHHLRENEKILAVIAADMNEQGEVLADTLLEVCPEEALPAGCSALFVLIEGYSGGRIRGVHFGEDDGEPDAPPSGDLLNPEAMRKFIELTHDRYYEVLKEYFGNTVIAMFTDEPDVKGRGAIKGSQPWTVNFAEYWKQFGGKLTDLPLLWKDAEDGSHEAVRRQYQKAVYKRLSDSYYRQISEWCAQHNIALTGHPAKSDDIGLLKHFHIPGQDVVWRWVAPELERGIVGRDSTMGKCSSDAARHSGKRRNSNECFGCCGPNGVQWAFACDDMKWYLDWMFVRGVNLLYPHAFFYSIDGEERFGERPPDVGPNNTFWPYYKCFSDYMKRMCWLMTDSYNTTPVAVLGREDYLPWEPAKELFCNQLEFNYLEDTLLLDDTCRQENGWLKIQKQAYRVVLTDSRAVLPQAVEKKLADFVSAGGYVLFWDKEQQLADAVKNVLEADRTCPQQLAITSDGTAEDLRVSHVVKEGQDFYLLTNEGENSFCGAALIPHSVAGVELWDAWNGTFEAVATQCQNGRALVPIHLDRRESIIIYVGRSASTAPKASTAPCHVVHLLRDLPCGAWKITAGDLELPSATLTDWSLWPGMEEFSGTVTYEASFEYHPQSTEGFILDLGNVHEIAAVSVNGCPVGIRFWAPYRFDVTAALHDGLNSLRIEVTNTPANRMMKIKQPSGLILS